MVYPSIPWALVFAWISIQKTSRCGNDFYLPFFSKTKTHDCVFAIEVSDFLNVYMDVSKK